MSYRDFRKLRRTPKAARPTGQAMNRTEVRYASGLALGQLSGEVVWWSFESIKLRLADATFYTPDFIVRMKSGELYADEIKGFWRDDARVKFKVAREMYCELFHFRAWRLVKEKFEQID